MARRRYVQINGELVEVTPDYMAPPRDSAAHNGILWNDRAYQDMNDPRFKSRTQHREFMAAHGLSTVDDYQASWRKAEQQRVELRQALNRGASRTDIVESIQKLNAGYRPRLRKED